MPPRRSRRAAPPPAPPLIACEWRCPMPPAGRTRRRPATREIGAAPGRPANRPGCPPNGLRRAGPVSGEPGWVRAGVTCKIYAQTLSQYHDIVVRRQPGLRPTQLPFTDAICFRPFVKPDICQHCCHTGRALGSFGSINKHFRQEKQSLYCIYL